MPHLRHFHLEGIFRLLFYHGHGVIADCVRSGINEFEMIIFNLDSYLELLNLCFEKSLQNHILETQSKDCTETFNLLTIPRKIRYS